MAHIDAVITALPQGYDTVIDEHASTFSGGERQRLALARALVKDAPILLLDEPTAALDELTEAAIDDTLRRLRRDRTLIVVTHRMAITSEADHVVVFEDGQVVADMRTREVA
jgi:ATP-binding cassette, subfamily B, bacterial